MVPAEGVAPRPFWGALTRGIYRRYEEYHAPKNPANLSPMPCVRRAFSGTSRRKKTVTSSDIGSSIKSALPLPPGTNLRDASKWDTPLAQVEFGREARAPAPALGLQLHVHDFLLLTVAPQETTPIYSSFHGFHPAPFFPSSPLFDGETS